MLVLDQTECLGQLHDNDGHQGKGKACQIGPGRKDDQTKGSPHGGEQHQGNEQERNQTGQVQIAVGERPDAEQGVIRAHVVGLDDLGQGEHQEGHGLTAGESTGGIFSDDKADKGQDSEHDALEDHPDAEAMGKDSLIPGTGLLIHDVAFHSFHILSELYKLATDYAIIDGGHLIDEFSKETLESACSSGVHVMVEPEYLQEAKTLIAARYPDVPCEILSNQSLRLHEKINPADLNQFLVENKVRVCGLGANDGDIEKFFVEKLSGGQAV